MPIEVIKNIEAKGITRTQIARRMGVSYGTVHRWATGKTGINTGNIIRLKQLLFYKADLSKIKDLDLIKELQARGWVVKAPTTNSKGGSNE